MGGAKARELHHRHTHIDSRLPLRSLPMSVFHDEVEIEDFEYDPETETYYFPCPCGDQFQITKVNRGIASVIFLRSYLSPWPYRRTLRMERR